MTANRQVVLAAPIAGTPTAANFTVVDGPMPVPGPAARCCAPAAEPERRRRPAHELAKGLALDPAQQPAHCAPAVQARPARSPDQHAGRRPEQEPNGWPPLRCESGSQNCRALRRHSCFTIFAKSVILATSAPWSERVNSQVSRSRRNAPSQGGTCGMVASSRQSPHTSRLLPDNSLSQRVPGRWPCWPKRVFL